MRPLPLSPLLTTLTHLFLLLPPATSAPTPTPSLHPPLCTSPSLSLPNPLPSIYPNAGTGTANGTLLILPISLATARLIIPPQYPILTTALRAVLPDLPKDQYPMYAALFRDHDLRFGNVTAAPDFSRASLVFPFVDRLGNGHSSFRYGSTILVSVNPVVEANEPKLQKTVVGSFEPACEAYAADEEGEGGTYVKAWRGAEGGAEGFDMRVRGGEGGGYSVDAIANITNQPLFGSGTDPTICDDYVGLFNTSISTGKDAPAPVIGDITVLPPFYPTARTWKGVRGLQFDSAWVDRPGLACGVLG